MDFRNNFWKPSIKMIKNGNEFAQEYSLNGSEILKPNIKMPLIDETQHLFREMAEIITKEDAPFKTTNYFAITNIVPHLFVPRQREFFYRCLPEESFYIRPKDKFLRLMNAVEFTEEEIDELIFKPFFNGMTDKNIFLSKMTYIGINTRSDLAMYFKTLPIFNGKVLMRSIEELGQSPHRYISFLSKIFPGKHIDEILLNKCYGIKYGIRNKSLVPEVKFFFLVDNLTNSEMETISSIVGKGFYDVANDHGIDASNNGVMYISLANGEPNSYKYYYWRTDNE